MVGNIPEQIRLTAGVNAVAFQSDVASLPPEFRLCVRSTGALQVICAYIDTANRTISRSFTHTAGYFVLKARRLEASGIFRVTVRSASDAMVVMSMDGTYGVADRDVKIDRTGI